MPSKGYIRFPTIFEDAIIFVAEDDLWFVSSKGGRAERLTASVSEVKYPHFSPDGSLVAFVGKEEGPSEVYVMPAQGGPAQRLTYQGTSCRVVGWLPTGDEVLYASSAGQFTTRFEVIYAVNVRGGLPRVLPFGMASAISYSGSGGVVIGRNTGRDFSHWKRYRGGTVGHLWCDEDGDGTFQRLLGFNGNVADPCWVGERIYVLSDHEGVGNVYSCTPNGDDLQQHTFHTDFYARHLSTDGRRMVYHAGAELYLFDPQTGETICLDVILPSLQTQRNRKFAHASSHLDTYALHPQGYAVAITTRGKAFTMGNWGGPVLQYGQQDGVRYRFLEWLNDGRRLLAVHDAPGKEELIIFTPDGVDEPRTFAGLDLGRVIDLALSPIDDKVVVTNHRNELIIVDLEDGTAQVLDQSDAAHIRGIAWSPDGCWVAYGFAFTEYKIAIKLGNPETGETFQVTKPVLQDVKPSFDPEGRYLYFLGYRIFNPVHDNLQFDWGFPRGMKPYVILLRRDLKSPFIPEVKSAGEKEGATKKVLQRDVHEERNGQAEETSEEKLAEPANEERKDDTRRKALVIDLEGIGDRVLPFPVPEGRYKSIRGIKGKVLFLLQSVEGTLSGSSEPRGFVDYYDLDTYKVEHWLDGVSGFDLSRDNKWLIYRQHRRLRVLKAGDKSARLDGERPGRESGWLDLSRIKVSIQPLAEWRQMFAEAWRLQREQFWSEDMLGIDWPAVYNQYVPLVERVASRSELSDLLWELQGELGTSHAYEMGGEYRLGPNYHQGFLGVDWSYDREKDCYRIERIIKGDPSDYRAASPLTSPGLNIVPGSAVLAINGQCVGVGRTPQELLVNQSGNEVQLLIEDPETLETRVVVVKALGYEGDVRYRQWVDDNRHYVHKRSQQRIGYIHIPDMGSHGYAEFHRSYLAEFDYPALLIDVRWNSGGSVSGLLLEKLARCRIGYDFPRWSRPIPYPRESPCGPMVALTNEHAGSDGDIFSHSFKLMGLGPLIGKRTWGGVVGINPRHRLVDGTTTTQPEYSFWFKDVGWNVENYGTDPDIEVDIAPQDYARGEDPQLERAISEALRMLEETPILEPKPGERPYLGRRHVSE